MSYEITIKEADDLWKERFGPDTVSVRISDTTGERTHYGSVFLQRPDALELAAAHEMRLALEGIARGNYREWDEGLNTPEQFVEWAQSIARAVLATVAGKKVRG